MPRGRGPRRRAISTTSRSAAIPARTSAPRCGRRCAACASPRYVTARLRNMAKVRDVARRSRGRARRRAGRAAREVPRRRAPPGAHRPARSSSRRSTRRRSSRSTASATSPRRMLARRPRQRIEVLDRVVFPHSLGIFYTAVTQWLGFPEVRRRGQGDGPRALRRADASRRADARARPRSTAALRARPRLLPPPRARAST